MTLLMLQPGTDQRMSQPMENDRLMADDATYPGTEDTLWRQVSQIIRNRVRDGVYPLESVLPREVDLADELGVSRNTVREAFRLLADEGLLDRRKRAGTRVVSTGTRSKLQIDLDPQSSLRALSRRSDLKVISRCAADLPPSIRTSLPELTEGRWHRVSCVRVTATEQHPLSWTEVYLAPDLEDISLLVGTQRGQQFRLIETWRHELMVRTRTLLFPVSIQADIARQLDVKRGAMALRVLQAMINGEGICREVVDSIYPAERYSFEMTFPLTEAVPV
ncbi:MAG: GntR family transcriptional regulator [Janthinobacterium lividum]